MHDGAHVCYGARDRTGRFCGEELLDAEVERRLERRNHSVHGEKARRRRRAIELAANEARNEFVALGQWEMGAIQMHITAFRGEGSKYASTACERGDVYSGDVYRRQCKCAQFFYVPHGGKAVATASQPTRYYPCWLVGFIAGLHFRSFRTLMLSTFLTF